MKITFKGETKDLLRFINEFDWMRIFEDFRCTIIRKGIDKNTVLFTFGLPRHPLLGVKTADESKLTEILEKACVKYNLKMQ